MLVYYQNVRGLRTKVENFYVATQDADYDVIVLTETWLNDEISSQQLFGQQYTVYRNDRDPTTTGKQLGGGVLIAVANKWASQNVTIVPSADLEQIFVKVMTSQQTLFLGVVYMSPDTAGNVSLMERHFDYAASVIDLMHTHDMLFLFGDYNQPNLNWMNHPSGYSYPDPIRSSFSTASSMLVDKVAFLDLKQINSIRNTNNRLLDLLFINHNAFTSCEISPPSESLLAIDAHHPVFTVSITAQPMLEHYEPPLPSALNFRKANFEFLNAALNDINWQPLYDCLSVDEAVSHFTATLNRILSNNHLKSLKRKRASALRYYNFHKNATSQRIFTKACSAYKKYNRALYSRYVIRTQSNLKHNPKGFWAFVNEKRKESGLPTRMHLGNDVRDTLTGQCELFATHFSSVFANETIRTSDIDHALLLVPPNAMEVQLSRFSLDDIRSGIKKMKSSASPGPDGIPTIVLKNCVENLIAPLLSIFNRSLATGEFPSQWKKSTMFPAFKKGDKTDVQNYRGITSLCAGSKLFEILVTQCIMSRAKSYISPDQHGFFPGRSISTNLTQFTSHCLRSMEKGYQIDTIYTDLKAAFDRVNHRLLLAKLNKLGVADGLVKWLESYLIGRHVSVKLGSKESLAFSNPSGIPQGSNLGPLLFSIFVNDVFLMLPEECRLGYADDLKLFYMIKNQDDCLTLQRYINLFADWCTSNRLFISVSKCAVISFTRKTKPINWIYEISNEELKRVSTIKDLGVLLDQKMTFRDHYASIIAKANRNLGFITRISKEFRDPYCLRSLFYSIVRSSLETASVVWSPYIEYWSKRIEAIQSRFIRYALRFLPWNNPADLPDYRQRCRLLGMETMAERRVVARASFVKKLLSGEIDCPALLNQVNLNVRPRALREQDFLRINFQRTSYGQHEPVRSMLSTFNWFSELDDFNVSTRTFQSKIRSSRLLSSLADRFN